MTENPNRGAIRFTARFIQRTKLLPKIYGGGRTLDDHMPTLVYHNTSANPPDGFVCKCLVDPKMVFQLHIHEVRIFFSPTFEFKEVPISDGIIRHYRDPLARLWNDSFLPKVLGFGSFELTDYHSHMMKRLYDNVKARLDFVYEHNSN